MITLITRKEEFGNIEYNPQTDKFNLQSSLDMKELANKKLSAPLTLHWLVTLRCNARCPYCYAIPSLLKPSDKERVLSPNEISSFIDDFAKSEGFRLYLTGGEPTLHPYLTDILRKSFDKNIKCVVNSNGIQIPEEVYESLRACQSRLSFSLDSHLKEVHDNVRKQKSYDNIVHTLKKAAIDGLDTRVISVKQDNDEEYWIKFGRFLNNLGVKNWFIQSEISAPNVIAKDNNLEFRLREELPKMKIRVLPAIYDSFLYVLPDGKVANNIWTKDKKVYGVVPQERIKDIWNRSEKICVKDYLGILQINAREEIK